MKLFVPLTCLSLGETARIQVVESACPIYTRLLDLGFFPGTTIRFALRGFHGEICAYELRGSILALRKEAASYIYVERDRLSRLPECRKKQPI